MKETAGQLIQRNCLMNNYTNQSTSPKPWSHQVSIQKTFKIW